MKKKILVFLCAFAVIFACFPITAFAQTSYPNFIKIGEEQGINLTKYAVTEDDKAYYILAGYAYVNDTKGSEGGWWYTHNNSTATLRTPVYKCLKSNPYKKWTLEPNGHPNGYTMYGFIYKGQTLILSNFDVYTTSDKLFFKQTPLQTATPLLTGVIKDTQLKNVLNELIAVLPVLIPCVIALIAIRKGIKFTLATLRTA